MSAQPIALKSSFDLSEPVRAFLERFRGILKAVIVNLTTAVQNSFANSFTTALDAGTAGVILVYSGTIPADANTAISAQTLLATLTFSATSFGAASAGVITANAITSGTAVATGTASFARLLTQGGGTTICDVNIGTSAATIVLNTTSITSGSTVAITAWTMTMPANL